MTLHRTAHTAAPEASATGSSVRLPRRRERYPARQRSQAVVEFGLVVLLFVLLISGMFDFGMFLNGRLSISSLSRVLARAAAANATQGELDALANAQGRIIGVTTDGFVNYCCGASGSNDAIVVTYNFYSQSCSSNCSPIPPANRTAGDRVVVDVNARGMEVFTLLARPAFGCSGSVAHCLVPITAQTTMRVERTYP